MFKVNGKPCPCLEQGALQVGDIVEQVGTGPVQVLFAEEQIHQRTRQMAREIAANYGGSPFTVLPIMKGVMPFAGELLLELGRFGALVQVAYVGASSYTGSTVSAGTIRTTSFDMGLTGRRVLVLDDIADTRNTFVELWRLLQEEGATEVMFCALFNKEARNQHPELAVRWIGFEVPDVYIEGWGIDDSNQDGRQRPFVGMPCESSAARQKT